MLITREYIKQQIDKIEESRLEEFFRLISSFIKKKKFKHEGDLMANLRSINIDGPKDFSENLDLYLSGEKLIE